LQLTNYVHDVFVISISYPRAKSHYQMLLPPTDVKLINLLIVCYKQWQCVGGPIRDICSIL